MQTIYELLEFLKSPEVSGEEPIVAYELLESGEAQNPLNAADRIAVKHGLSSIGKGWMKIEESTARTTIARLFHKTLAYRVEIFSEEIASHLASTVINSLNIGTRTFLSNGTFFEEMEMAGFSITRCLGKATMEFAVVALDSERAVFIFAEDED